MFAPRKELQRHQREEKQKKKQNAEQEAEVKTRKDQAGGEAKGSTKVDSGAKRRKGEGGGRIPSGEKESGKESETVSAQMQRLCARDWMNASGITLATGKGFTIDQTQAEQLAGDAGFLNEHAPTLARAFGIVAICLGPELSVFMKKHPYLLGLLVQANVIDASQDMQAWTQDDDNVFICATCTVSTKQAGLCRSCSWHCHKRLSHRVICIGRKTDFVCDCGDPQKFECLCMKPAPSLLHNTSDAETCAESQPNSKHRNWRSGGSNNKYNHNFNMPPQYCYTGDGGKCLFSNSGSNQEFKFMSVKVAAGPRDCEDMARFAAGDVLQCVTCEDWFHPRCTFDQQEEIMEAQRDHKNFLCNLCHDG